VGGWIAVVSVVSFQGGALMALGIIASGVEDQLDLSSALLRDHITNENPWFVRLGAMLGLGFACASSKREAVTGENGIVESLKQVSNDPSCLCGLINSIFHCSDHRG
jgi:hypothetical protein